MARSTGSQYRTPFLLVLIVAGLAGNYFNFPLFLNIDFLFGSIFALLALQFFGLGRGILAAACIASTTYFLWNEPYAFILMTAEVAVVGWLMGRRKLGMVLADTLYWLLIGMPLAYLFYHLALDLPFSSTFMIMTKQAVNGIANALLARLIFTGYTLRSRSSLTSYREIVYNLLAFFVLCPTLIMLAIGSRADFTATDLQIRSSLIQTSESVVQRLETWVINRKSAILNLAEMAAAKSPEEMQPFLEQTKKSDINFQRIGLHDKEATTTAYFPLFDERGEKNIGKNYADRSFIPTLKRTLQPMLSEVEMGRVGIPRPRVLMLAPVVVQGEYGGYVAGILDLEQIREHLDKSMDYTASCYTLLDKNGKVIMSNRTDQTVMTPFVRGQGKLNHLGAGINQWVPTLPPNTSISERWKNSFYVAETPIGDLAEWRLILEQPVAPFQQTLYDQYSRKLTLLFLILIGALALAELLSRKTVMALGQLSTLTHELPVELAVEGKEIAWPKSGFEEAHHLINNFKEMAELLSEKFIEIRKAKESLEERVEERTEALRRSEEAYRTVADFTYDWEYWLAPDGNLRYVSPACERHTGYRAEEFRQDPDLMDRITHPDDRDELASHLPIGQDGEWKAIPHHIDFRITTRSGEERWFAHVCQPVYGSSGEYLGQRASNRDITERRQTEEELIKATIAAEAANIAKSQFLATMSHEIRTPMNGVIGLTELLLGTELTTEQREYAELVKLSGRNLVQLISDILDVAKIEAHKIELETVNFDLQTEITDTINLHSLQAQEKGLALSAQVDIDVPLLLKGDGGRLRQILTNLIGNAIKFTATGAVTLHIRKDGEDEQQTTLHFRVRDSGIGIAQNKLEKIFEPFTQADSSATRNYGGTGLGLTIVRQLAELMGGSVGVESVEGQGTTFWFTVVLEKQIERRTIPRSATVANESVALPREKVATGTNARILLVEDDPINQLMTKLFLTRSGYLVEAANNGSEAIKALEKNDYDLVLMDCMMPVLNGYEATTIIRNQASAVKNHAISVIAQTANALREDREMCLAAGMDDYLAKPIELTKVLTLLEKWLPGGKDAKSCIFTNIPCLFDTDIFAMAEFVNRSLGDLEHSRYVAAIFIDNGPDYLASIGNALAAQDAALLHRAVHKLKGAAATMALPRLTETAALLEALAGTGDLESAAALFPELAQRFEQAVEALRVHLINPAKGLTDEHYDRRN